MITHIYPWTVFHNSHTGNEIIILMGYLIRTEGNGNEILDQLIAEYYALSNFNFNGE